MFFFKFKLTATWIKKVIFLFSNVYTYVQENTLRKYQKQNKFQIHTFLFYENISIIHVNM